MRMPVAFVSHGAPTLALDTERGADLTNWAASMPQPSAVLVISAHWLETPPTIGTRESRPLLYDFSGFPPALESIRYEAPAASDLAAELQARIPSLQRDDDRPWDHGVWVPLRHMFPFADVPVLQLSMPWRWPVRQMFALGRLLAPLRDQGVLLLASGGAVHNLGQIDWDGASPPPAWAVNFEGWLRELLVSNAFDDIVAFREKAPDLHLAHPTDDHFVPLIVALGAAGERHNPVTFPITGFEHGSLSRLAVQFG